MLSLDSSDQDLVHVCKLNYGAQKLMEVAFVNGVILASRWAYLNNTPHITPFDISFKYFSGVKCLPESMKRAC